MFVQQYNFFFLFDYYLLILFISIHSFFFIFFYIYIFVYCIIICLSISYFLSIHIFVFNLFGYLFNYLSLFFPLDFFLLLYIYFYIKYNIFVFLFSSRWGLLATSYSRRIRGYISYCVKITNSFYHTQPPFPIWVCFNLHFLSSPPFLYSKLILNWASERHYIFQPYIALKSSKIANRQIEHRY